MEKKLITIKPTGGLANRLRVLFSFKKIAEQENKNLSVIWLVNESCNGSFTDYFEPLQNINFLESYSNNIFYEGCYPCIKDFDYSGLELNSFMKNKLELRLKTLGQKYTAAHLRKTDIINLLIKRNIAVPNDSDFLNFFRATDCPCFLATDNSESQIKFKNVLGDKLVIFQEIQKSSQLRQTSLETSILDLYTCFYANKFKGTTYSSFTNLIISLRKNNG